MPHWTMHPLIAADGHTDTKIDALGSMKKKLIWKHIHVCLPNFWGYSKIFSSSFFAAFWNMLIGGRPASFFEHAFLQFVLTWSLRENMGDYNLHNNQRIVNLPAEVRYILSKYVQQHINTRITLYFCTLCRM